MSLWGSSSAAFFGSHFSSCHASNGGSAVFLGDEGAEATFSTSSFAACSATLGGLGGKLYERDGGEVYLATGAKATFSGSFGGGEGRGGAEGGGMAVFLEVRSQAVVADDAFGACNSLLLRGVVFLSFGGCFCNKRGGSLTWEAVSGGADGEL